MKANKFLKPDASQFTEEVEETNKREARVLFGSNPEPKTIRLGSGKAEPSLEELSEHKLFCSEMKGPSRRKEVRHLMMHISLGLYAIAGGAFLWFIFLPKYPSFILFLATIFAIIFGPTYIMIRLISFLIGPKLGTPVKAVKQFIGSLDDKNYGRAWNCLTPRAQEPFESLKDFKGFYRKTRESIAKKAHKLFETKEKVDESIADKYQIMVSQSLEVENIQLSHESEETCVANFDIVVKQSRSISKKGSSYITGTLEDGQFVFPQATGVVHSGKYWLLTSGSLDIP